ncbi:MAG: hypothetical protein ABSB18_06590 [Candidatus Omnitrophota bacterium]
MRNIFSCCVLFLALCSIAYCAVISRIELTDGSVIEAEVISFEKGTYTVRASSLGEIKIGASKIRTITTRNTTPVAQANMPQGPGNAQVLPSGDMIKSQTEKLKERMMNDPEAMKSVTALLLDPQFQGLLNDPEISGAVKSQDIKALMQNEKFLSILNNQKFQEMQNKLKGQNE